MVDDHRREGGDIVLPEHRGSVASGLGRFETLVVAVETAETTLLGVVTAATAAGVLWVKPAQPAMTAESQRHPIPW